MQRLLGVCSHHLLVLITLFFLAGAITARWLAEHGQAFSASALLLPLLLPLVLALFLSPKNKILLPLPFFFLVGLLHTTQGLHLPIDPQHIVQQMPTKAEATVVGRLISMPEFNGTTTRCVLACEALLKKEAPEKNFQPIHGRLRLTIAGELTPSIMAGDLLMVRATIDRLHRYQTPGAFNYPLQMAVRGIYNSAWVTSQAAVEQIFPADRQQSLVAAVGELRFFPQRTRQQIAAFIAQTLPQEQAGVYQALLTGTLVRIPSQILELFKAGGTFHLLAISGLHFSLIGLFCLGTIQFLLKRSQWLLNHTHVPSLALLLTAPLLLLYGCIAGLNLPALRALITALLVLTAVLLRRQRSLLPLISGAALFVLALRPLALFTASFQLSFAAVLAINLISPKLPIFNATDPDAPQWQRGLIRLLQTVQSMFYVSLAATAGTLPILLLHFNRVSLVSPFTNLIIEPLLCLWALPWGLVSVFFMFTSPQLAQWCLQLGSWGVETAIDLLTLLHPLPHLSWWTVTPTTMEMCLYYFLLWLLIARPPLPHRLVCSGGLALTLLLSSIFFPWNGGVGERLHIDYLDVGQGTSTLIRAPEGETILLDGGGYQSARFNVGESLIAPFLWQQRIRHLDRIIITHPHGDHYNGLPFILSHFQPKVLVVNGDHGQEHAYTELLAQARRQGIEIRQLSAGDILYQDSQVQLACLGMPGLPEQQPWDTNDRSLVLLLQHYNQRFLFPADIGFASEQVLLRSKADLEATVLLAPHHGSRGSSSDAFIDAVDPQWIIVSSGRNRWGVLPAKEHVERWQKEKRILLTTAIEGTIQVTNTPKALRARTFNGMQLQANGAPPHFPPQKRNLKALSNPSMLIY
ncbi:DNA internalization-related competence protein ComEC/Rec2 [Desulfobulbus rhabdoformis]|uniref:DNA internalization-related competence protein ComEC/Rec2 n=1 Tax=Desulfobulbus rhabdoformis TaxID=34032 RepID=UPI0019669758|nr:DNA internalization-related competence protein ComEC/Rec2 [Desulfobulbus rhabdoformis]MBM9615630.1 DNA internalization-related competence protein ComEC/Rec2 [Desulfobulbus rhabdoformis]